MGRNDCPRFAKSPGHGGGRALHCRQLEVVVANARMLCSPALRSALHVHYTTAPRVAGARGPPQLEL